MPSILHLLLRSFVVLGRIACHADTRLGRFKTGSLWLYTYLVYVVNAEQLLLRCRYRLALQVYYLMRVSQRALTWHKGVKLLPTLFTNLNIVLR